MDAAGYLRKHGWRGSGHSLDVNNNGLKKPLLVTKKIDVLGIGINKHDVIAGQWWMKAFDSSLKDFGTGKKSLLGQVKEHGIKRGGLYGRFVQGEGIAATIGTEILPTDTSNLIIPPSASVSVLALDSASNSQKSKKRKAESKDERTRAKKQKKDDRQEQKAKKEARRATKLSRKGDGSQDDTTAQNSASEETTQKSKRVSKEKKSSKREPETLESLSADKRTQYEERAKAKGLSLEDYFSRRQEKNIAAAAVATATSAAEDNPWAGRKTADLSEEERKARRKWMRQRTGESGTLDEQTPEDTARKAAKRAAKGETVTDKAKKSKKSEKPKSA